MPGELWRTSSLPDMTYPKMEEVFLSYLGDRYTEGEWKEARDALFSSDGDDNIILSRTGDCPRRDVRPTRRPAKSKNPYLNLYAGEDNEEDEEDEEEEEDSADESHSKLQECYMLARILISHEDVSSSCSPKCHRLHCSTPSEEELPRHSVGWLAGQIYVVADSLRPSPMPFLSHFTLAVKKYVIVSDENVKWSSGPAENSPTQRGLGSPMRVSLSHASGSRSLLDRSRLLNGDAVSNINCGEEVIGWTYKGEKYYMGLLLKTVHRDRLELVICPHADDIWLHLQSGWGQPFLKKTVVMFSMQFLRTGDWVRIVRGDLSSETSQVISTDHPANSATLELTLSVRSFQILPRSSPASVTTLQAQLPTQQFFKPPPDIDAIQIGDSLLSESPTSKLWQFTQDRGYDVRPGDVVRVACGPNYTTKGVIRRVDFINAHLTLLSEIDHSLIPSKKTSGKKFFIIGSDRKGYQATLYSFSSETCTVAIHGQQRTTIQLKDVVTSLSASTIDKSSSTWTTWTSSSEDIVTAGNPSSLSPSQAAAPDPWSVNINDMLDGTDGGEKPKETWLMNKEFSYTFTNLSHDVESLALFHARQATQSIRVNSLS
ncbi:hypothetical protein DFJ58DRAFT_848376 [Suillus subalutaceus]|uniref:uncharacterized protein n=1 Tax=Suillus subalutaceus TaxID=48586 RepID=UPI001B879931|nr:uncharacterized protein DFJ58DRAFT_848376 [Suillus subalutaceus]KAG1830940.1 hypothetical protein DFJ58DRAFT_848376 [Suillus subalutaceus]